MLILEIGMPSGTLEAAPEGNRHRADMLVTGARTPIPIRELGSASTVLEGEDIERRQNPIVSDLLRGIPGLAVSRAGGVGGLTQIRIRGAEGNHTKVMIDGIDANELNSNGEFDFSFLNAAGIERIEILRGSQSALYGSDAIGGVVNIITTEGMPGFTAGLTVAGGSFVARQIGGQVSGGVERLTAAATLNYLEDRGNNISRFGEEKDGFRNVGASLKVRARPTDAISIALIARYADSRAESDAAQFNFPALANDGLVQDSRNVEDSNQFYGRAEIGFDLFEGVWTHKMLLTFADTEREFSVDGAKTVRNGGERLNLGYQTTVSFGSSQVVDADHSVTVAFEREEQDFFNEGQHARAFENQRQSASQNSIIGEYRVGFADQLFLTASIRRDDNDRFDDSMSYRVTGAWFIQNYDTRIHTSYGTGVTNPGFFELFGYIPTFYIGNPWLEPEKSKSVDVGVEQTFLDGKAILDLTYFHADLTKEIITTFDFGTFLSGVDNLDGQSKRDGMEISLELVLAKNVSISGSYTFSKSRQPDGMPEVRRPRHTANLNANFVFGNGRGNLNLNATYNGKQADLEFVPLTPESRVTLNDYLLVTLAGSYRVTDRIEVFARAENLFDESYEEIFSYRSRGIGVFGGIRIGLGT